MAVQISGNDITVPRDGSFTRNVTIGGTLTYEDVTNIDSVGLVTARSGIEIGARPGVAASISVDGNMIVSGISTFGGDVQISSGGKLGIGTVTPGGLLHTHASSGSNRNLIEASAGNSFLRLKSGSTSNNSGVEFFSGSSNTANVSGLGAGGLQFEVGGSERLRILASGHVNIGDEITSDTGMFKVIAADGDSDELYVGQFENREATAGRSYGVNIRAGSNSTDHGFRVRNRANDTTQFLVNGDGKIGIGDDTPDALLSIKGDSDGASNPSIRLKDGTDTREAWITNNSGDLLLANGGNDNTPHCYLKMFDGNIMVFATSNLERARIDSNGSVYFTTVDGSMWNNTDAGNGWSWMKDYGTVATKTDRATGYANMYINKTNTGSGSDERWINFIWDAGDYGNIKRSGSGVNYQSNSDYRLKENVVSLTDGISRLKNLKPSRFNWKSEPGATVDGFIAHEAQTVVPEAVDGVKDQIADDSNADTENGTPIYQKMDNSKLVPLLTAALQEAVTKIEALEARVATLEGS